MINKGTTITLKDQKILQKIKNSPAYSVYLESIANSPAYITIMNEHIRDIDVTKDIEMMKKNGILGGNVSTDFLNKIMKSTIAKSAINLLADSIILKELDEKNISEVENDIKKEFHIIYLLGAADRNHYVKAKELYDSDKISKDSLTFKGLVNYIKHNPDDDLICVETTSKKCEISTDNHDNTNSLDLESDSIKL